MRSDLGAPPVRRVFDEAVARLDPEERRVLRALSAFAGGMTWEAAIEVGRARAGTIRALADRSFLRLEGSSGRYALHEVLRAFAAEELAATKDEETEVLGRHSAFFSSFLRRLSGALAERAEKEARESLASELENVRAAWTRAIRAADTGLAKDSVVLLEQIRTLDKHRLRERAGQITAEDQRRVDQALDVSLGLSSY